MCHDDLTKVAFGKKFIAKIQSLGIPPGLAENLAVPKAAAAVAVEEEKTTGGGSSQHLK
jgi:hypothetical protein